MAELVAAAQAAADAARPETLRLFRAADLGVESKGREGFDPVTEADRAAERAIRTTLARLRPHDALLGEEYAPEAGQSGLTWVIDPIDGTRAYMCGAPTWGTLVAVSDDAGPILGLIDQPYTDERFFGGPDGAWLRTAAGCRTIRTRPARPLEDAVLMTTFPEVGTPDEGAAFRALARDVRLVRYGLDCYAYALVALGGADLVVEAGLNPYDIQGPMAVVQAAGGVVTDWRGGPAHLGGRVVAAANAEVHAAALEVLAPLAPA